MITNFITFMLKSLVILVIRLAHTGTIYTQTAPLFSLNCIFSPANEEAVLKYNNQSDFKAFFEETNEIGRKWTTTSATFFKPPLYWINKIFVHRWKKTCLWATEFWDFKMDITKPYLDLMSCNFGLKTYLWFQIKVMLCLTFKSHNMILHQTALQSVQFLL